MVWNDFYYTLWYLGEKNAVLFHNFVFCRQCISTGSNNNRSIDLVSRTFVLSLLGIQAEETWQTRRSAGNALIDWLLVALKAIEVVRVYVYIRCQSNGRAVVLVSIFHLLLDHNLLEFNVIYAWILYCPIISLGIIIEIKSETHYYKIGYVKILVQR